MVHDAHLLHGDDHFRRDLMNAGNGAQGIVDLQLGPGGQRGNQGDDNGGRMSMRTFLESLGPNQHSDMFSVGNVGDRRPLIKTEWKQAAGKGTLFLQGGIGLTGLVR